MSTLAPEMAKDPAKKRIEIHVQPELKEALIQLAKADKRSLLNYIETVLERHVKAKKK
jgi:predicted HicB family RNase H-like nuclease